jgi:hypothetical protein
VQLELQVLLGLKVLLVILDLKVHKVHKVRLGLRG